MGKRYKIYKKQDQKTRRKETSVSLKRESLIQIQIHRTKPDSTKRRENYKYDSAARAVIRRKLIRQYDIRFAVTATRFLALIPLHN